MTIDFHTHTFPEQIAARAITKLSRSAHIRNYSDGTVDGLKHSMEAAGIDCAVLLPVATRPSQQEDINHSAIESVLHFQETGILSFGGIHPDSENYRDILKDMARHGVPGVKLHPVFQQTNFDDIRYLRIMDCAAENNLIILTHAGFDASFPGADFVSPARIRSAFMQTKPDKLVLAHMGGWDCWNEAEAQLSECDVYLDTSFTLSPLRSNTDDYSAAYCYTPMEREQFLRMVRTHGADHVLFGSDSPWADMSESLKLVRESGLSSPELDAVLGGNAAKLLKLPTAVQQ